MTISNIAPKITLGGRVKACKIIGCNSEYFWGYSHSIAELQRSICVMKIILTEKVFGVGSSNFGFFLLDNWATR